MAGSKWWSRDRVRAETSRPGSRLAPTRPKTVRITAAYDADVSRWRRGLGEGDRARMNAVLRVTLPAVIAKEIERRGDRDWKRDLI